MYLLEKECEEVGKWFQIAYPMGKIKIHIGQNGRDEEYNIEFHVYDKHFSSQLIIPHDADKHLKRHEIEDFRRKFVTQQKEKITKAARTLLIAKG